MELIKNILLISALVIIIIIYAYFLQSELNSTKEKKQKSIIPAKYNTFLEMVIDKSKFSVFWAIVYKIKIIFEIFFSKHFIFLDIDFKDLNNINIIGERFRITVSDSGKILKSVGEEFINYSIHCDNIENLKL